MRDAEPGFTLFPDGTAGTTRSRPGRWFESCQRNAQCKSLARLQLSGVPNPATDLRLLQAEFG